MTFKQRSEVRLIIDDVEIWKGNYRQSQLPQEGYEFLYVLFAMSA